MEIRRTQILKKIIAKLSENQIAIFLVLVAILFRLIPHPANFAPIGAIALFGGVYLKHKQAMWLPLAAMIVSDLIIGLHSTIIFTWGSFLLIAGIGMYLKSRKNLKNIVLGTVLGSLVFYFVTNFGVWAATPLYAKTTQGLIQCYLMAVPFFRNTLASDIFYVVVFFGAYELVKNYQRKLNHSYIGKTVKT